MKDEPAANNLCHHISRQLGYEVYDYMFRFLSLDCCFTMLVSVQDRLGIWKKTKQLLSRLLDLFRYVAA